MSLPLDGSHGLIEVVYSLFVTEGGRLTLFPPGSPKQFQPFPHICSHMQDLDKSCKKRTYLNILDMMKSPGNDDITWKKVTHNKH